MHRGHDCLAILTLIFIAVMGKVTDTIHTLHYSLYCGILIVFGKQLGEKVNFT